MMRLYFKRLTVVIMALLLMTMLFAGCDSKETTKEQKATEQEQQTSQPPEEQQEEVKKEISKEPVTIKFWHNYDAGAGQVDVLDELIAQFETENPNIKVEHLYLDWSALKNNVVTGAATGMLPDVMRGDIGFIPQFQSLDVLVEMDTEFNDYEEAAATVLDAPNSTAAIGDHFCGLAANTNTKILYYNKDLVTTAPTSLADMWLAAEQASSKDVIGFCEAWMGGWNLCQYIWSEGGDVLSEDYTTATGYINGEIAVNIVQTMADLFAKGAFNGPSIDPGAPGDTDGLGTGKYAMTIDGPWKAKDLTTKYPELNFGTIQLPAGKAGSIGVLGGEDFMIFKTSDDDHKAAAWEFIKFMTGKDAQIAMAKVGQMPVNKEALESQDAIEAMPLLPIFSEALKTCKTRPVVPEWGDISGIINTKATEAVLGVKPVQTAMDEAADEINALLQK